MQCKCKSHRGETDPTTRMRRPTLPQLLDGEIESKAKHYEGGGVLRQNVNNEKQKRSTHSTNLKDVQ